METKTVSSPLSKWTATFWIVASHYLLPQIPKSELSFHVNINLHYIEINATGFTLLKTDTERQEHLPWQLIKALAQIRRKHDLDCLL